MDSLESDAMQQLAQSLRGEQLSSQRGYFVSDGSVKIKEVPIWTQVPKVRTEVGI